MNRRPTLFLFVLSFVMGLAGAPVIGEDTAGERRVLLICGHPGDGEHRRLFAQTIDRLYRGLTTTMNVSPDLIDLQFGAGPDSEDPVVIRSAQGRATREEIADNVRQIEVELRPNDSLWVIVIGHAHFDGRHSHLNLPGPDLSAEEFGKLFQNIGCREQVFFLTCPASSYFIPSLSKSNRVVITATEDEREVYSTQCAAALADVLTTPPDRGSFDVDGDDTLTLLDLYVVLVRRVIERFHENRTTVTEHALLDDNGDGSGTEVQVDYLSLEQGGRWKSVEVPARPRRDGTVARKIRVSLWLHKAP